MTVTGGYAEVEAEPLRIVEVNQLVVVEQGPYLTCCGADGLMVARSVGKGRHGGRFDGVEGYDAGEWRAVLVDEGASYGKVEGQAVFYYEVERRLFEGHLHVLVNFLQDGLKVYLLQRVAKVVGLMMICLVPYPQRFLC